MYNISGFGLTVSLIASNTFPLGLILTEWPDDQDAIDFPAVQIADATMGVNGDLIFWTKGAPVKMTLGAIPDSITDIQLALLLAANRVGKGKISARDTFQAGVVQGNGNLGIFTNGVLTEGMPFNGVSSAGRMKTKQYLFTFENYFAG